MSEAPRRIETAAVIGLGDMGSALARALLEGGHGLVVYNRTPAKADPLVGDGARRGETAEDAVGSADLVLDLANPIPAMTTNRRRPLAV